MSERWALGRDAFLAKFGGWPAERYVVVTADGDVDALALLLGARSHAGLGIGGPWRGDQDNVADPIRALGFRVGTGGHRPHPRSKPQGGVEETALRRSWDNEVDIDGNCRHIEVKGPRLNRRWCWCGGRGIRTPGTEWSPPQRFEDR